MKTVNISGRNLYILGFKYKLSIYVHTQLNSFLSVLENKGYGFHILAIEHGKKLIFGKYVNLTNINILYMFIIMHHGICYKNFNIRSMGPIF